MLQRCPNATAISLRCPPSEVTGTTGPDKTPTFLGYGFSHRKVRDLALQVGSLGKLPLWATVASFQSIQTLHLDMTGTTFPPTATAWLLPTGRGLCAIQKACLYRRVSMYVDAAAAVHTPPARMAELCTVFPLLIKADSASPSWVEEAHMPAMRVV
jgi:hypothetical protein